MKRLYTILVEKSEEKDHMEDTGQDGKIILRWIIRKWVGGMDWIDLAQDMDRR